MSFTPVPARPACWLGPGSRQQSSDQPRQRLRITAAADPHSMPVRQLSLDEVLNDRCRQWWPRLPDDLYWQKP